MSEPNNHSVKFTDILQAWYWIVDVDWMSYLTTDECSVKKLVALATCDPEAAVPYPLDHDLFYYVPQTDLTNWLQEMYGNKIDIKFTTTATIARTGEEE